MFDLSKVWTLWKFFHAHETLVLTTEPSRTSEKYIQGWGIGWICAGPSICVLSVDNFWFLSGSNTMNVYPETDPNKQSVFIGFYTKITDANLSIFVYRLCCEVFTPLIRTCSWESWWAEWKLHKKYRKISRSTDRLASVIFLCRAHQWALYHVWFQNKFELFVGFICFQSTARTNCLNFHSWKNPSVISGFFSECWSPTKPRISFPRNRALESVRRSSLSRQQNICCSQSAASRWSHDAASQVMWPVECRLYTGGDVHWRENVYETEITRAAKSAVEGNG